MTRSATRIDDLLDVDSLLAPEEIELRQTVRRFGEQRLRPHIAEWFEIGEVPVRELASDFGKLGLLGMHLKGYGCGGSTATAYGLVCQELEAVDSGLRSMVSVQGSLAMFAIHRWGSEEQRKQWLPAMATGDVIGCFGLTEPDFGSNPAGHAHHRPPRRLRLDPQRLQDVDHQRLGRRHRDRVGPRRGRHPRVHRAARHARDSRPRNDAQTLAAGVGHLGAEPRRRAAARRCPAARSPRACRARWPACRRRVSASCSAASAPPGTAWRPRWTTSAPARCSTSRWRAIS